MSCFEVIKPNETNENKLADGAEIIHHEENAFANHYKNSKSFDDVEEVKVDKNSPEGVHFSFDFKVHPDGVKKLAAFGNQIQSNSCVLQHNLVMFSYAYSIIVVGEDVDSGLICQLRLIPFNHTYRYPIGTIQGGVPTTFEVEAPELLNPKFVFGGVTTLDLERERDGSYLCKSIITLDSLKNITEKGVANLRLEVTIDSDFFDLGQYVPLYLTPAPVAPNSNVILEKILAGEEVPKSDWVISVGEGTRRDFHVHGPVVANASLVLKAAITSHMSIGNTLAMVSHEKRFILPKLHPEDMRVLLTFIYQRRFVLPEFDAVSRVGNILTLLMRDEIPNFFKSWEVELINKVMGLDRYKTIDTIVECLKALISVHSSPKGALLGAYNAALVVAADAWQIEESKGKNLKVEKVKKALGKDWQLVDNILELIDDYKNSVCGVEKSKHIY